METLKEIKIGNKKYNLVKYTKDPFHILYSIEGKKETYLDLNRIIEEKLLLNAIWVEVGTEEQKVVNSLPGFFESSGIVKQNGYNNFEMYNTIEQ